MSFKSLETVVVMSRTLELPKLRALTLPMLLVERIEALAPSSAPNSFCTWSENFAIGSRQSIIASWTAPPVYVYTIKEEIRVAKASNLSVGLLRCAARPLGDRKAEVLGDLIDAVPCPGVGYGKPYMSRTSSWAPSLSGIGLLQICKP